MWPLLNLTILADASVSTSALEDALNSNFKQSNTSRTFVVLSLSSLGTDGLYRSVTSRSRFGSRQGPA